MIYTVYMWILIIVCVLLFGTALSITLPFSRKGRIYDAITRGWGKTVTKFAGVPVKTIGFEKVDRGKPHIYMTNHQSYFDVICQTGFLPQMIRFVAKKELVYLPFFGQVMWAADHIIIDRSKQADAVAEMKKAGQKIRDGISILVYPEGTRSPDRVLCDFKKGGFMMALEAGVPIIPVSMVGTSPMMPKGRYTFTRTKVTMVCGDLIDPNEYSKEEREGLMDRVRAEIIRNFPRDSAEWEANKDDPVLKKFETTNNSDRFQSECL